MEMFWDGRRQKAKSGAWTKSSIAWSPLGTYLATFHSQGILIWGGPQFEEVARFVHPGVKAIDFSPCEKYIVTSNFTPKKKKDDPSSVIVWDIQKVIAASHRGVAQAQLEGKGRRGFDFENKEGRWPILQWSHDDKYFARVGVNKNKIECINIYETPSMMLLDKKSIEVPGCQEVSWSPRTNIISYWMPEGKNQPATVALREIPSREILREKHLYSVQNIKMFWQSAGDYLAVQLSRRKSKKTFTTNFELFRMREKNVPVEVIELESPEVVNFSWQPRGHMFSVAHAQDRQNPRPHVSLYQVKKKKTVNLYTLNDKNCDAVVWCPALPVAALCSKQTGRIEFYHVKKNQSLAEVDHFKMTSVQWDPSGRYLLSISAQPFGKDSWQYAADNGYKLWTFQGDPLVSVSKETLFQALWRPRPKTLLTSQKIASIRKNLRKDYWDHFEAEANKIKEANSSAAHRERTRLKETWKKYRRECEQHYVAEATNRVSLRGGVESDDEDDLVVVDTIQQTILSISEEPI